MVHDFFNKKFNKEKKIDKGWRETERKRTPKNITSEHGRCCRMLQGFVDKTENIDRRRFWNEINTRKKPQCGLCIANLYTR